MAKRYAGYTVRLSKRFTNEAEARRFIKAQKELWGGSYDLVPQALDRCPGDPVTGYTMDHAHARYDGEKWCSCCKAEL